MSNKLPVNSENTAVIVTVHSPQLAPVTNSRIHSNSPAAKNALTPESYSYAVSGVALPATSEQ